MIAINWRKHANCSNCEIAERKINASSRDDCKSFESSGFFVNVFFDSYKGRMCGCWSTRLSGRFIRGSVAFAKRSIPSTGYGRGERTIRFRTIFLTGLTKRSSPANGRSRYWFSMADQRGAKQKVPTRRSSADPVLDTTVKRQYCRWANADLVLMWFLDQPSDLGIVEHLSVIHSWLASHGHKVLFAEAFRFLSKNSALFNLSISLIVVFPEDTWDILEIYLKKKRRW